MRYLLACVTLGVFFALQASGVPSSLDELAVSELEAAGLPGVSYAIVDGGTSVSGAQGEAELGTGRAVTPDTPFQIGSITKSFTAIAILQLVEAGDVDLDGELAQYLDAFQESPGGAITIRQLLAHTSGYSTRQGNDRRVHTTGDRDELSRQVERIAAWAPAEAPGARWDYSNANYILLGGVIEAVSGSAYDRYIEVNIFEPAGMTGSRVGAGGPHETMAVGHTPWFGSKRPARDLESSRAGAPAGGVIASANDLALYLQMLLNGKDDIISAQSKALMMQPASDQAPYYGLGWMLDPQAGTVYHTGTSPGTETLAILLPEERKAVVVLVNAGSGLGFGETGNLINRISAYGLGLDYAPDKSAWRRKALFLTFALLPLMFLIGTVQAWRRRSGLRSKSGVFGAFSLWFPLFMTSLLAWVSLWLIPSLFGVSLGTLRIFAPDLSIVLLATAVTGLIWSVFRLCVYYSASVRSISTS